MPKIEDLIRLIDVPALLTKLTGTTRGRATIYNWATKGRRGYANEFIKLKIVRRLGTMFTTEEWVMDFIKEIG